MGNVMTGKRKYIGNIDVAFVSGKLSHMVFGSLNFAHDPVYMFQETPAVLGQMYISTIPFK